MTPNPDEKRFDRLVVAGHVYNVFAKENHMAKGQWVITATECIGRWPMSRCATGDLYLDAKLQTLVTELAN